ncbi:DNA gyrase inhibitor YacG [Hahella sp. SMD15-11]|uniref:DNA gyrase inhibitor YacG n=1 Tax=Thermohahella caldifontis TaxID=3142973 RepID=A0AB39UZV9_9GAMM
MTSKHSTTTTSGSQIRTVKCPTCRKPVPWIPESRFRPFCSERCRLIDLGAWADEAYRIPETDTPEP